MKDRENEIDIPQTGSNDQQKGADVLQKQQTSFACKGWLDNVFVPAMIRRYFTSADIEEIEANPMKESVQ